MAARLMPTLGILELHCQMLYVGDFEHISGIVSLAERAHSLRSLSISADAVQMLSLFIAIGSGSAAENRFHFSSSHIIRSKQ